MTDTLAGPVDAHQARTSAARQCPTRDFARCIGANPGLVARAGAPAGSQAHHLQPLSRTASMASGSTAAKPRLA